MKMNSFNNFMFLSHSAKIYQIKIKMRDPMKQLSDIQNQKDKKRIKVKYDIPRNYISEPNTASNFNLCFTAASKKKKKNHILLVHINKLIKNE